MGLAKFEIWVHDHILKNDKIRHFLYAIYQRVLYAVSSKIKFEGNIIRLTPDDSYEYLFGYYDKCPWDETGRYLLALRVKSTTSEADSAKEAELVLIDLQDNNKAEVIAKTHSWNVQQGCMAQWLGAESVLYNDFRDGKYCAVILNLKTREERIIDMPVYSVSSDGKTALTLDFSRLHRLRPGYGYANITEETRKEICPDKPCIWKIDILSGEIEPLLKYTDFAGFETRDDMIGAEHKVNHLMLSPDGKRFMVLHRWFKNKVKYTRLLTCNIDGTQMYNLSDDDFVSHCCWKNNNEILSYLNKSDTGKGYYIMKDKTREYEHLWPQLAMDGHPTYLHNDRFHDICPVVTDTYPDRKRIQSLYVMTGDRVERVARVFSPFKFGGDVRCDLHPRWSKDGTQICFDASFEGKRQVYAVQRKVYTEAKQKGINKTVSIIMPCYNCGMLIDETMQSLQNQTYQNFEVICVNDGSTDNTLSVLEKWQQKGMNIKIINQPNGGVSVARNRGIKEVTGKYVLFLDSDDAYHPESIERLICAIETSGADIAYCKLNRRKDAVYNCIAKDEPYNLQTQTEAMNNLLYRMGDFGFCCYIYKTEKLHSLNLEFDINTKFGEDREFNWKYITHCQSAAYIDMPLYWYRVNNASATKSKASWRKTDLLTAVKRIEAYLVENNCGYSEEFNSYMYARAMWAVAKTFAVSGEKELYKRLIKEFDVKNCMKRTAKDNSKIVALASKLYLIRPMLFYNIVRLKK